MAGDEFESTHWSDIFAAAGSSSRAREALERLCDAYWFPLYAYLRRRHGPDEAQDLTQEFFAKEVLTGRVFKGVDPLRGSFRAWVLASLKHFTANAADARNAQKRGGGAQHEASYLEIADPALTPEELFERSWGFTLIARARDAVRARWAKNDNEALFHSLHSRQKPYAEL